MAQNEKDEIIVESSVALKDQKINTIEIDYSELAKERYTIEFPRIRVKPKIKVKGGKCYAFFKRTFDIFASLLGIIILSPLLIIVGLLVKCTSKGPIIYVSKRIGMNGRVFNFYKFRSMYKDADKRLEALKEQNEIKGGVTFKMKNDPRITPFGKLIRKTSIDELPQLFNVLKGDMSIVGPRPSTWEENQCEHMTNDIRQRQLVPQGLTGEWQTHGRSSTTFDEMIKMDLDYIQNKRSFWYDIKLCLLTIWCVITGRGAE